MKFEKKQLVLMTVILVMLAVFIFLQYIPTVKAIEQAKLEKQQKQTQQSKVEDQMSKLPELISELEDLKADIGNFQNRIPNQRDLGKFLQDVTVMMNTRGLSNQLVRPGVEKSYKKLNVIPIDIECSGTLDKVFGFFKDLEGNDRLLNLERVRFENSNLSGNIKVYAKGNIFYRQDR